MVEVYRFDSNGIYIEPLQLNDNENIPDDCTEIKPEDGLFKAKFVDGAWVESETDATLLQYVKDAKKAELNMKCDLTIMGGFTSSALGVEHTYQSLLVDEVWLNATINRFAIDPNFTTVNYKTIDSGYLLHTKDQFNQVFIAGHSFGDSQIAKLNSLKAQVDSATDKAGVDAVTW
jgi:hypothetical protein